jgi:hypothetical protein
MLLQAPAPAKALPSGWSIFVPIESERKLYLLILTRFSYANRFLPRISRPGQAFAGKCSGGHKMRVHEGRQPRRNWLAKAISSAAQVAVTRKSNVAVFAIGKLPLRHYALTESWTLAREGVIAALVDYATGLCDAVLRSVHGEIRGY